MKKQKLLVFALSCVFCAVSVRAKEVAYELTIEKQVVNFTGKSVAGMTINGGIPGPVLRFTEGDTAVMRVTNKMDVPTSVHWHGLLVPPDQDGVPFISYPPIAPGTTFTYRFPIRQSGTYWYHSHTALQEQLGVYGSIVIQPKKKRFLGLKEHVVLLSDWTDRDPHRVMRLLRRGSEYMVVEKKGAQSLLGAWKTGKVGEFWKREAMRMPPMDLADVAYDAFLINGKQNSELKAEPGETVRLRIIDGSASSFFHLQYAGGPLKIIAADGQDVESLELKKPLLIGVAEVYDVLVKVPANGAYEFRATAHDGSGYASMWIGSGEKHAVQDMPNPFVYDTMNMFSWKNLFGLTPAATMGMPDHEVKAGKFDEPGMHMTGMRMYMQNGEMKMEMDGMKQMSGMGMKGMDHGGTKMDGMMDTPGLVKNPRRWYDFLLREDAAQYPRLASDSMMSELRPFAPYAMLKSVRDTSLNPDAPKREIRLTLDGSMTRYIWKFNNQPLAPSNDIMIKEGEVVRFIFINRTMMHHPLHLHGHFFRVINGQGDRSPLKHTVDVEPMTTTVIEFEANELGDWFFHCHLLYHMKAGMARVVRYEGFTNNAETEAIAGQRYPDEWYLFGMVDILSSETQGGIRYENQLNAFMIEWEAGWQGVPETAWEAELTYDRYFNRFTSVYVGAYGEGIYNDGLDFDTEREVGIVGIRYLLPLNFQTATRVDTDGEFRFKVGRELMLTPRLGIFGEAEYDSLEKWSYQGGASYMINANLNATAVWDSVYGVGAGITFKF